MDITEEVFKKEIAICKKQFAKSGGCNWGRCEKCGVVPLLVKLHKKLLLEEGEIVEEYKNIILKGL